MEHRKIDSPECGCEYRPQFLRSDAPSVSIVRLGRGRAHPVSCALARILSNDQLRPLAARSHRDRRRELAAAIRSMGSGKGRQHLGLSTWPTWGGFAALLLRREWDIGTLDGWRLR